MRKLIFFDTTLRDGEQCPGFSMTTDEKIRLALQLEKLGVDCYCAQSSSGHGAVISTGQKY